MNVVLRLTESAVEFVWVGWWGLQSHFRVQPNNSVDVVLRCVVVGVVTIYQTLVAENLLQSDYWWHLGILGMMLHLVQTQNNI